jgi:hypothetical protein
MEQEQEFPEVSPELVRALESMFPERSADPRWTDREVWIKSGECNVVRFVADQLAIQNGD